VGETAEFADLAHALFVALTEQRDSLHSLHRKVDQLMSTPFATQADIDALTAAVVTDTATIAAAIVSLTTEIGILKSANVDVSGLQAAVATLSTAAVADAAAAPAEPAPLLPVPADVAPADPLPAA
jgi:hypothetical protein